MADKSPWWRSFVGKRRSAARESAREAMLAQEQQQAQAQLPAQPHTSTQAQSAESPQQASAELTHTTAAADHPPATATEPQRPCSEKRSNSVDDLEPTFNESTSRRNLRVSRSGRFKERKRVRVSLLQDEEEHAEKSSDKDGASAPPGQ
ncbi:proline-rich protein 15 [Sardina pilchardus]|uniref:proline-rich protein 15 n=1 Tax=Sardina pilchardus TaxID=27697 RepID=UPI002E1214F1